MYAHMVTFTQHKDMIYNTYNTYNTHSPRGTKEYEAAIRNQKLERWFLFNWQMGGINLLFEMVGKITEENPEENHWRRVFNEQHIDKFTS